MRIWVNFMELRKKLSFEEVLRHYGVEINRRGSQHQGICPLPKHSGARTSPSFSANLERGIFQCFSCGAKGNVLEFAALMQGVDPSDGDALRSVAVELQQQFFPEGVSTRRKGTATRSERKPVTAPVVVNAPLDFDLKGLDAGHWYLARRGFTRETMYYFGVGFCSRGFLKDRIAIPLHNQEGKLLGYAGRVIDDTAVTESNPRYRFPSRRERAGTIYEFRPSLFVYNGFRLTPSENDLIVVNGFTSVWWLNQSGFVRTVATMADDCSDEQSELILSLVAPKGKILIVSTDDKVGRRLPESLLLRASAHRSVRWIKLEGEAKLTARPKDELRALLSP